MFAGIEDQLGKLGKGKKKRGNTGIDTHTHTMAVDGEKEGLS
jgi:hypothetical protein